MDRTESIHDYRSVLAELELNPSQLGCVMLPVRFREDLLKRLFYFEPYLRDSLYTSPNPEHFWIKGDVTESAHITLLYGLLKPAWEQEELVYRLLDSWFRPPWLPIAKFEAFPSPYADERYRCIVARIGDPGEHLAEAHARLSYLPHVDTHPTYKPHATVAYVQEAAADRWLEILNNHVIVGRPVVFIPEPREEVFLDAMSRPVRVVKQEAFDLGRRS